jgi:hypothetical protein
MFLIPVGGMTVYFHVAAGLGIAAVGLVTGFLWLSLWQFMATRAHQKALKKVMGQVPVYRQMLASYPAAMVVISSDV